MVNNCLECPEYPNRGGSLDDIQKALKDFQNEIRFIMEGENLDKIRDVFEKCEFSLNHFGYFLTKKYNGGYSKVRNPNGLFELRKDDNRFLEGSYNRLMINGDVVFVDDAGKGMVISLSTKQNIYVTNNFENLKKLSSLCFFVMQGNYLEILDKEGKNISKEYDELIDVVDKDDKVFAIVRKGNKEFLLKISIREGRVLSGKFLEAYRVRYDESDEYFKYIDNRIDYLAYRFKTGINIKYKKKRF